MATADSTGNAVYFEAPANSLFPLQVIPTTLEKYFSGGVYLHLAIRAQRMLWVGMPILCGGQGLSLRYLQCKSCLICNQRVYLMQRERI